MLPSLDAAQPTIHNLHSVARLLGAVRLLVLERQPNYLELGLSITRTGLSSARLPNGGEVRLDFTQCALIYQPANAASQQIPLEGRTQSELLETLLQTLYARELNGLLGSSPQNATEAMFTAVAAFSNRLKPRRDDLSGTVPLSFDRQHATDYATALDEIFTGIARFRAHLNGSMTPIVIWPEHFDLSFLWFATPTADEQHPHLNFGFAPYSGGIDEPYLYAYAYPYPAQYDPPTLPTGVRWNTDGWTGVVLPYGNIAAQNDAAAYVETCCLDIYRSLNRLLG